ncbi:ATP-binding cassette domain-containing protein [Gilvimarinus agarilyticus]|uniref:ATP-binding cassette domain-containing protein n=1 Tax=Gilvimarinus sp. 2_MG-2023 TaxID=3062666 RepID=UPI001C083874|nr:ATP-binding cassette domain-containing protein [Gilvimarinus sp. 2_MG-2023]MBU2884503.1 ATP-binding cassette domain-containing protein [Gilvimarinus agarilyticus]MDO6569632.1 ATP-binding cassette domain-containing protein [Gilvimarinus sp. 2_MG-2023]
MTETPLSEEGPKLTENLAAKKVWRALFREKRWLRRVIVATCLINLLAVSMSLFAMQVYDRVVPTLAYATLTTLTVGMIIVIGFDWSLKTLRARILDSLASAVDIQLSQRVYEHLLKLRLDTQPKSLGTLAAQVNSLDAVRQFFSSAVIFALVDLPFALMFLVFIAIIGGKVAWVYAALLPIALTLGLVNQWRLRRLMREQIQRSNERQGLLVDTIRGAETIRASGASNSFGEQWRDMTGTINRYTLRQRAINSLVTVTATSLSMSAYVGAIVVGVWQIEAGLLTMGGMIACSILGGRIIAPVAQSAQYLMQWQQVSQSLRLVHDVLSLPGERRHNQTLLKPNAAPQHLQLEKIRFGYPGSPVMQVTLDELTVHSGERTLLLGPVGSGKSTLLKVMAGLLPPTEGRVRLGDADLWEIDPTLVSQQIGYLPQHTQLFRGTLRSNLLLGNECSDDELVTLCRDLGIDKIVDNNPLGLDLVISEGGDGLSGGQRQLVALGRLILARPKIWLLDEPGAGLDRDTEERFWQCLESALSTDDILVVSTHRPMIAGRLATRAMIMADGVIQRDGAPEAILPMLKTRATNESPATPKKGGFDVI